MPNKKNLLIYAHYYIPDTASTGQILRELAEGMLDKFNITVICVVPSYLGTIEDKYKTQKYYEEEINGVKVLRIRVPEFSKTNKKSRVKNIVSYFFGAMGATFKVGKMDYVFSISQPPILGGLLGVWGKWVKHAKYIYNIQDFKSLLIDNSKNNYRKKQKLFTSMPNLQLVTVSKWLEGEVRKSFLKNLQCTTIYNGIDLNIFKPTDSDFRKKYSLEDKIIVLGVASTWDVRKGLNDFIKLSSMLSDEYRIVLVGVSKEEKARLPQSILGIERTNSVEELSEIYTASDVFFNASVEETFGLPTVEAMACGTPVIVYDCTALPEVVNDQCGFVVKEHDLKSVIDCIKKASNIFEQSKIVDAATKYSKQQMANNYIKKYRNMMKQNEEIVKINGVG